MTIETSRGSRLGLFMLAALGIMMAPVAIRSILRMYAEHDASVGFVTGLAVVSAVSGFALIASAAYGLYFSLFGRDPA